MTARRQSLAWRVLVAALAAGAAPIAATPAQAPPAAPAAGLTVDDAVRSTLAASPRIQHEAQELRRWGGTLLQAAAPFDPQLRTSAGAERENSLTAAAPDSPRGSSYATDRVSYTAAYEWRLRSGFVIAPEVGVSRAAVDLGAGPPTGTASATLRLGVPLLNNRGGRVLRAAERVAELDYEGNVYDVHHAAAASVQDAVAAYWGYAAALARLEVQSAAEARAHRLLAETRLLIRADERPAADTQQLLANVATKQAARINAEQQVVGTRAELGLAMGLGGAEALSLPPTATAFPAPPAADAGVPNASGLVRIALARRADVRGGALKREASQVELQAATENLKPRLDLSVGVGYVGMAYGWGAGRFFSPLHRNVPGLNSSVQLNYQLPTTNADRRGRTLQLDAFYEQQRIAERDMLRRVVSDVTVAAEGMYRAGLALAQAARAVTLSNQAVESERRKFQLGTATLFDIINAEDALTNALLSDITARRGYAVAVVAVRFATGTLAEPVGDRVVVPAGSATTPP